MGGYGSIIPRRKYWYRFQITARPDDLLFETQSSPKAKLSKPRLSLKDLSDPDSLRHAPLHSERQWGGR
jgi:hypothetical protein